MAGMFSTSDRLGIVTGLAAEARAIGSASRLNIGLSAANPTRAADAARKLIAEGATVVASVGLAAGLDLNHAPGTIIIADRVVAWTGALPTSGPPAENPGFSVAPRLTTALAEAHGDGAKVGTLVGLNEAVTSPDEKLALMRQTGAAAADMESHIVAQVAEEAGVPWFAVRIVADPSNRRVPPAALAALGAEGDVSVRRVLKALARSPGDLPDLLSLALDTAQAMRQLKRAGRVIRAEFD
ncbi:MAG: purine phosphorylase [Alphaproteobacteria bacterium]|jgi:adenosylhomocysteine nucleosidase|nr:purine phosphorylase [Alphaproteobacteria bacterium]